MIVSRSLRRLGATAVLECNSSRALLDLGGCDRDFSCLSSSVDRTLSGSHASCSGLREGREGGAYIFHYFTIYCWKEIIQAKGGLASMCQGLQCEGQGLHCSLYTLPQRMKTILHVQKLVTGICQLECEW